MSTAALADLVLREPVLAQAMDDAKVPRRHPRPHRTRRRCDPSWSRAWPRPVAPCWSWPRRCARPRTSPWSSRTCSTRRRVALYPAWETLPARAAQPAQRHRRAPAGRAAPAQAPGRPTPDNGPLQVVVAPVRSRAPAPGQGSGRPRAGRARRRVRRSSWRTSSSGSPQRRTPASTWSRSAASSPSAAASSTSSRRPRSTRVRVEFFGDEVDEIRTFAVADQRTLEPVERLWAPPCRELLLTDDVRRRAAALGEEHPQLAEITDKLAEGMAVEGMESLSPALVDEMEMLVELLPADTPRPASSTPSGSAPAPTTSSRPARSSSGRAGPRPPAVARRRSTWARPRCARSATCATRASSRAWPGGGSARSAWRPARRSERARGEVGAHAGRVLPRRHREAVADIRGHLAAGRRVVTVHQGHGPAQRMVEVLGEHDVAGASGRRGRRPAPTGGVVEVTQGCLAHGLASTDPAWSCSPARTSPARRPPRATCARCRRGARSRSTRSS